MSNILKFSDLKSDSFDKSQMDEHIHNSTAINGFLTIDLNNQLNEESLSTTANSSISSGYTSFGQQQSSINTSSVGNKQSSSIANNSPKKQNEQPSIDLSATGTMLAIKTVNTIDSIKQWSTSAYKCTKQVIQEKLGKTSRTVDPELEAEILRIRENKKKYEQILALARSMIIHFNNFIQTQKSMSDVFSDLAVKSPELRDEFSKNSETQRAIFKNGENLINSLEFFAQNLSTLCSKSIEDTLCTIRSYEAARLEFDAYRTELEKLQLSSSYHQSKPLNNQQQQISQTQRAIEQKQNQLNELEKKYKFFKDRYEKLREDVNIKIKFLDENKVKVMQNQLILFNNATSAYFSGNKQGLESTMKQFNVKLTQPSFLEKN